MTIEEWLAKLQAAAAVKPDPAVLRAAASRAAATTTMAMHGKTTMKAVPQATGMRVVGRAENKTTAAQAKRLFARQLRSEVARTRGALVAELKAKLK